MAAAACLTGEGTADQATSLSELLAVRAREKGEVPLFSWWDDKRGAVELGRQLSYASVELLAARVAWRLANREGVGVGDRCVLVYEPCLSFVVAFLGCGRRGCVAVPVFPPEPRKKFTAELGAFVSICGSCDARFALTSTAYGWAKKAGALAASAASVFGPRGVAWPDKLKWIVCDADLGRKGDGLPHGPVDGPHAKVAFLQYTSGSTSEPKGVVITHASLTHNLALIVSELKATEKTVCVSWLPQYHDMGLIGSYLGTLRCGGSGFYASPFTFVKRPACWLEAVATFRGTHMQAPNFAYALATRKPPAAKLDLTCVEHMIDAAEPVDKGALDAFVAFYGREHGLPANVVFPTYGLAESTVMVTCNGAAAARVDGDALRADGLVVEAANGEWLVGCGAPRADAGVDVAIVSNCGDDDDGPKKRLGEGRVGEIWVSSPSAAAGYWDRDCDGEFRAELADGAGGPWLRTGDVGFLLRGELFVCGRLKDLVILRGKNHYPQDIERSVERAAPESLRPGCVAAFAVDDGGEERLVVLAEVRDDDAAQRRRRGSAAREGPDGALGYGALAELVANAVAAEHGAAVDALVFLKPRTIAKTTSGKIARKRCKAGHAAGSLKVAFAANLRDGAAPPTDETTRLVASQPRAAGADGAVAAGGVLADLATELALLARRPADSIRATQPLVDSGIDSMDLAQFKGVLEAKFGCAGLPDDLLFRDDTTLLALAKVVEAGGAFDEAGFANIGRSLEIDRSHASSKKSDFMVDNCPCCLVCCPSKLR